MFNVVCNVLSTTSWIQFLCHLIKILIGYSFQYDQLNFDRSYARSVRLSQRDKYKGDFVI